VPVPVLPRAPLLPAAPRFFPSPPSWLPGDDLPVSIAPARFTVPAAIRALAVPARRIVLDGGTRSNMNMAAKSRRYMRYGAWLAIFVPTTRVDISYLCRRYLAA